jgi:hypothetical protein
MGLDLLLDDFLIQILSGLIVASIIGAATSFFILIRCVHRQRTDIALMKKAMVYTLRIIAKDTQMLHGDNHNLSDIDDIFKELMKPDW